MLKLDITKCVEKLQNYYVCKKCGQEYVFSNLQGRCCEKCNKPDGKCNRIDAVARLTKIMDLFKVHNLVLAPTSFTVCQKNVRTDWIIKEATATDKQNHLGEIPLHTFCKKRQTAELKQCITSDLYDINHKDFANWTPLHEAIENDFLEGVEILLKHGAVCNVPGMNYTTPLHKACMKQNEKIIKLLIEYGAKIDSVNGFRVQPIDLINSSNLKIKMATYTQKYSVPKTIYIPLTAKIFICSNTDSNIKDVLCKWFTNYKLAPIKCATHLVIKGKQLSLDILCGILKGLIIYDESKMMSSSQNVAYTLNFDFVPSFKRCFKVALLNRFLGQPPLFDKMSFHILKHYKPIIIDGLKLTTNDLVELIKAGGGAVLKREPTPSSVQSNFSAFHLMDHPELKMCTNFVIFDERDTPKLLYSMKELHHKSSRWLIESILRYKFL